MKYIIQIVGQLMIGVGVIILVKQPLDSWWFNFFIYLALWLTGFSLYDYGAYLKRLDIK